MQLPKLTAHSVPMRTSDSSARSMQNLRKNHIETCNLMPAYSLPQWPRQAAFELSEYDRLTKEEAAAQKQAEGSHNELSHGE